MHIVWGVILTIISSIGWLGQLISTINPLLAARLGLTELESDVDPTFYADVRGEAFWDIFALWTLPAAGVLLLLNNPVWVYFGLVGGGMYLYFAGRGIVVRRFMQRRDILIGMPDTLKVVYVFLALWGIAAAITIVMAVAAIPII
jgi:hypothetical protein